MGSVGDFNRETTRLSAVKNEVSHMTVTYDSNTTQHNTTHPVNTPLYLSEVQNENEVSSMTVTQHTV